MFLRKHEKLEWFKIARTKFWLMFSLRECYHSNETFGAYKRGMIIFTYFNFRFTRNSLWSQHHKIVFRVCNLNVTTTKPSWYILDRVRTLTWNVRYVSHRNSEWKKKHCAFQLRGSKIKHIYLDFNIKLWIVYYMNWLYVGLIISFLICLLKSMSQGGRVLPLHGF